MRERILAAPLFGAATGLVLEKIGDVRNRVVFDSGCGSGEMSIFFALQGATVIGIDKDPERIGAARRLARSLGVEDNCLFLLGSSESIAIDSESIDIVFSRSTIQYMERDRALDEYVRILKPGGCAALLENLPYNPFINLYRIHRLLTSHTREGKEYVNSIRGYITFSDIKSFANRFCHSEHHEFHLLRMGSIYLTKNLRTSSLVKRMDELLFNIDRSLFSTLPVLRKFAWFTALYCRQKKAAPLTSTL